MVNIGIVVITIISIIWEIVERWFVFIQVSNSSCGDDTLIMYSFCRPSDVDSLQQHTVRPSVLSWMMANRLQLKPTEAEVLWYSSSRRQNQIPARPTRVGNRSMLPVSVVCDLGVCLDADVTSP